MENGIYIGLSRQMVERTNMDIIANNVANMSTPGYRGQNLIFAQMLDKPKGMDEQMSFVYDYGQYQMTKPGSLRTTGNPLDIAVTGPGFIGVIGADGQVAYSRNGNFMIGDDGTLRTTAGLQVANGGGGPITVPEDASEISIDERGVISTPDGEVGQIMIAEFANIQELEPLGNNSYKTSSPALPAENSRVKQGVLEGSNVEPVVEMTRMIETLRNYQSIQKVMDSENERLRGAIQRLTRGS